MFSLFKKKKKEKCFFCQSVLAEEDPFVFQYSTAEKKIYSQFVCSECAKVLEEMTAKNEI